MRSAVSLPITLTLGFFILGISSFSCLAQVSITDDAGNKIILDRPAKRIVSLYGGITEIVCAIGACGSLVGVTKADAWPPSVMHKPKMGTHMRPNLELILGVHPDLVLQGSSRPGSQLVIEKLKKMGIKVAVFNPVNFSSLYSVIRRISILTGRRQDGDDLVSSIEKRIEKCRQRYPLAKRPRVFFEVSYPSLLFAGRKNMVNDIINKAGGKNCVERDRKFVRYGLEQILMDNPDVYLIQKGPMNRNSLLPSKRPNFRAIPAVREGRVLVVSEFLFSRPGPRSVEAVEQLRRFLYSLYGRKGE